MKAIGAVSLGLCLALLQVPALAGASEPGGLLHGGAGARLAQNAAPAEWPAGPPYSGGPGTATGAAGWAAPWPSALLAPSPTNGTPPATFTVERVASRLTGSRVLPAYSVLAFRIDAAEGDSLIFEADVPPGSNQVFDCYLLNAANYTLYSTLREGGDPNASVTYFLDYSTTTKGTEHTAFTTEPLPAGTYFIVLDNDERLATGALPNGTVTVSFALAVVNNSLPPAALWVILAGAGAAIYATIRWRPVFDARSPLLGIEADSDEESGEAGGHPDMDEGEGPPPHPR